MESLERYNVGRRALLGGLATGVATSTAGCFGGEAVGDDTEADDNQTEGDSSTEAFPEHPVEEPRDPPEGRRCDGPCGMVTTDWPAWNGQISHADGQGAFFDTPGCLLTYRHDQTFYGGPATDIENAWVRDFETKELIDATEAVYVLDLDKERLEEPMAHNPKPFAEREDAVAYVREYADLSKDDIVGLDGFGAEEANAYRDYPVSDDS